MVSAVTQVRSHQSLEEGEMTLLSADTAIGNSGFLQPSFPVQFLFGALALEMRKPSK